jgi:hypothetical protein
MGLNVALVDRARLVTKRQAGRVVDGETLYADVYGTWFKCRLELGREGQSLDEATGERIVHRSPNLMHGFHDLVGEPVELNVEDRLEVHSRQLGDELWDVASAPQPMRKKRRVIGWEVTLSRVETHPNEG